jgi:hypothetical protein
MVLMRQNYRLIIPTHKIQNKITKSGAKNHTTSPLARYAKYSVGKLLSLLTGVSAFGDSLEVRAAATRGVFGAGGGWPSRPMHYG